MDWVIIKGFPNYEISREGHVRHIERRDKIRKVQTTKSGYLSITLYRDGKNKKCSVHRLVYDAFVGIENPKNDIDHKNRDRENASLDNLREATRADNNRNKGPRKPTEHGVEQYTLDGRLVKVWNTATEAAIAMGGASQNIVACYWGKQLTAFGYRWKCSKKLTDVSEFKEISLEHLLPYRIDPSGVVINKHNKVMSQSCKSGYLSTTLTGKDKKKYGFYIHRLLVLTFCSPKQDCAIVNHIDQNTLNNSIGNLEWTTCAGNTQHSMAVKVQKIDLETKEVLKTYACISDAYRDLGKTYGGGISRVCRGSQNSAFGFDWKYA